MATNAFVGKALRLLGRRDIANQANRQGLGFEHWQSAPAKAMMIQEKGSLHIYMIKNETTD